ncbi:hypothetical protein D3C74_43010 [compost metagenome]
MKSFKKWKHGLYLLIALAMLIVALPRIPFGGEMGLVELFGAVWVLFSLMVIGANLHFLLGVDEEKRATLERVRKAKLQQWQLKWDDEQQKEALRGKSS